MKKIGSKNSLDSYIKPEHLSKAKHVFNKYNIDKNFLEDSTQVQGKIYILEETDLQPLPWLDTINKLAKTKKRITTRKINHVKAVILLRVNNRVFALSFSKGITLIKEKYIESDFGVKTNRKMIGNKDLKSIKSKSLSEAVISNHRYANKNIPPQYQLDDSLLSIVSDIKGVVQNEAINGFKLTVSGQNQIQLRVNEETQFLPQLIVILKRILFIYQDEDNYKDNFFWENEIKQIKDNDKINSLEKSLAGKINKMVERVRNFPGNQVTGNTLINIQLYPDVPDLDESPIRGFYISGIGYPKTTRLESLDEIEIFSRLAVFLKNKYESPISTDTIISKLKSDKIYYYLDDNDDHYLANVYSSIYYVTGALPGEKFKNILFQGKWYEVPSDFYSYITQTIDSIPKDHMGIKYIDFTAKHYAFKSNKKVKSEAAYNREMSEQANTVLFDSRNYIIDKDTVKNYKLVSGSQVEPCDFLKYENDKLQLVHAKIGRSGNGVSHLLNQAYVSSLLYQNDPKFLVHLNTGIHEKFGKTIDFKSIDNKDTVIVLLCIVEPDYVDKKNSATFPILTAVSIVKAVSEIKNLGFDCRLIKVPNKFI